MPYTTLVAGTTITAAWANANVRDQVITPFATTSARDSAITAPVDGMLAPITGTDTITYYNGAAWVALNQYVVADAAALAALTGLAEGDQAYQLDTNIAYRYTGSAWEPAGAATRAWTTIDTVTLGSTGAITFSSIPQTYSSLRIEGVIRAARAATTSIVGVRYNADTGSNYGQQLLTGAGATPSAASNASTSALLGTGLSASATASFVTAIDVTIPFYRGSMYKQGIGKLTSRDGAALDQVTVSGPIWRNTAAITQIDLWDADAGANSWAAGSQVALLGRR